jgi:hypothetical protein
MLTFSSSVAYACFNLNAIYEYDLIQSFGKSVLRGAACWTSPSGAFMALPAKLISLVVANEQVSKRRMDPHGGPEPD